MASTIVALVGVPSVAEAAADVSGSVQALAEQAAELVAEEHDLLQISTATNLTAEQRIAVEDRIRAVDASGAELLEQLDRLDVGLTQAIRIALGTLAPVDAREMQPEVYVPSAAVYGAAVDDLARIAAAPAAVTNAPSSSNSSSNSMSFGLLAVAALALLALGASALGNSLRRQSDPELEAAEWSDGVTGLANRRRLDADLARHDHGDLPTSAIMIEVDRFDEIVGALGTVFADEVLRRVGETIANQVRSGDIVYRCGDDEFCVLLPGASTTDAETVADRIVHAVRGVTLTDRRHVEVTVGVAGPLHGDATGAVRHADDALASAKAHGLGRSAVG